MCIHETSYREILRTNDLDGMCGFPCVHVQISASCIIVQVIVASNIPVMSTGIGGKICLHTRVFRNILGVVRVKI
jgi:hypothetical protein